jgi:hypothetical protein
MSTSLVAGLADRISDGGIAQILSELGPSTTRSVATLRDVLTDISRTSGPLTEAGIASLIYFFTDKGNQSSSLVVGLSSALLGSIVPSRGLDSTHSWNLDVVALVLSEDYSGVVDWSIVAAHFDTPFFVIKDASQFRALLDLYRACIVGPYSTLAKFFRSAISL